ncbi:hypothetical protein B0H14DRAFT_3479326 [Mycena olivaceomarginata]|nr:hypothetical protein B0H14DRAFT_3479326 [Mycena olivaceomarginata]
MAERFCLSMFEYQAVITLPLPPTSSTRFLAALVVPRPLLFQHTSVGYSAFLSQLHATYCALVGCPPLMRGPRIRRRLPAPARPYAFTRLLNMALATLAALPWSARSLGARRPHYSRCPPPGPRARRLPAVDALAPHPPPASRTCPGTSYAFTRLLNIGPRYSPLTALPLLRALVGCPSLMRWPAPAAVAVPVAYRIRPPPSRVAPAQLAFIFTLPTTNLSSNSPPRV